MGNLGQRERYYLMLLGIVVVVFIIYFFGIRNLGFKYDSLVAERQQLQAQLDYYEALKTQNDATQAQINELKNSIATEEARFLPFICTEALEQYVLSTFEGAGCPYLVSAGISDVAAESVALPDGTISRESLVIKRVSVQYSTTDGFNIPEYNRNISVIHDGVVDEEALNALLEEMYWHGSASITGYNEFWSALEELESVNPDCIKINSVSVSSEGGYMLLSADVDFYSATFSGRVSTPDTSAPYVTWAGVTNIDTAGGFIGHPFVIEDPNSQWFNTMLTDSEALAGNRPFATYYSASIFEQEVNARGLEEVLEIGDQPIAEDVEE